MTPLHRQRVLPEELEAFGPRAGVRPVQYHRPARSVGGRRQSAQEPPEALGMLDGPSDSGFKTERWRERGAGRWPHHAAELIMRQPCQFHRAEEVVPLQRALPNAQTNIPGEIWCRSLRVDALNVNEIGRHNQNVATTTVSEMFDRGGNGWSGKTNWRRQGQRKPPMDAWVERPVSVGKLSLGHLGGSRYDMSPKPRECVPNSMAHTAPARNKTAMPLSAR